MTPKRVQMSRQHPWRADNPDAVIVARPSTWGNPFTVVRDGYGFGVRVPRHANPVPPPGGNSKGEATALAVDFFRAFIPRRANQVRAELAGKDLACWCKAGEPCHADVLLEIANTVPEPTHRLDVYGLKDDREEAIEAVVPLMATPPEVVHHRRPWADNVIAPIIHVPLIPITRKQRWANLAFVAACVFVIGVVVYNVAALP